MPDIESPEAFAARMLPCVWPRAFPAAGDCAEDTYRTGRCENCQARPALIAALAQRDAAVREDGERVANAALLVALAGETICNRRIKRLEATLRSLLSASHGCSGIILAGMQSTGVGSEMWDRCRLLEQALWDAQREAEEELKPLIGKEPSDG